MTLPGPLHWINEVLAFLLELAALAVLAWWGWQSVENTVLRLLVAVAAPAAAAVVWGLFASPKATIVLPLAGVLAVKALVFGSAALALYALGRHSWAAVFAVVVTVNTVLATLDRNALMHK
ncbi:MULTISPECIES: YrdB family protein [Streptomyces]|uniref:YrdB family protein n=1 Tax=Streptomyces solicathayae TaxID=3081768 RepID=A0ABZ0LMK8_9ACTN|nr:YrdB family protein [Streptomyces sp. HUAS YS2]WOX20617.1 YrdB family protein [Streptomyces sp. HUAS YS2]